MNEQAIVVNVQQQQPGRGRQPTPSRRDVVLDLIVPLEGESGTVVGERRGTILVRGLPEVTGRDGERRGVKLPVSIDVGRQRLRVEPFVPLASAPRLQYRTRPVRVKPSEIEETNVERNEAGAIVRTRRARYQTNPLT